MVNVLRKPQYELNGGLFVFMQPYTFKIIYKSGLPITSPASKQQTQEKMTVQSRKNELTSVTNEVVLRVRVTRIVIPASL